MNKRKKYTHIPQKQERKDNTPEKTTVVPKWNKGLSLLVKVAPAIFVFFATFAALSCYPESEKMMEGMNYYANTPEFVSLKLAEYPGVNSLFVAWLLQFFGNATVGIVIEAMLLAMITLLVTLVPYLWKRESNSFFSIIPAMGIYLLFFHRVNIGVETLYFFGSLCVIGVLGKLRCTWVRTVGLVVVGALAFWFVSFPVTVLLMLSLTVLQIISCGKAGVKGKIAWLNIVLPLVFILVTVFAIKLYSENIRFIPFDCRWWYVQNALGDVTYYLVLLALPLALMFVPRIGKPIVNTVVTIAFCLVASVFYYSSISSDENYRVSEEVYYLSDLAERQEWQELLNQIKQRGEIQNNIYLQFALLAEAKLGTMPDNLFAYPINNPENICPRFDQKPLDTDLCRMFYKELGLYDEAFHQAFEYGIRVNQSAGFCMSSLRHMTEYAVKIGDKPLAEKYLSLLELTSCHSEFVENQRQVLSNTPARKDTVRSIAFVRAHPFNSEMAHLLDFDKTNKAAMDYLLCGLLLTKQLELFKTVLCDYSTTYKDVPLPRAYAEAAAMINHLAPGVLGEHIVYAPEYDELFRNFTILHNSKQDDSQYMGTFWYYYTNAQIPSIQDWQNPSSAATS